MYVYKGTPAENAREYVNVHMYGHIWRHREDTEKFHQCMGCTIAAAADDGRINGTESGFTLIELMVVLLIMGILMAIVPGLLSIPKENLPYPERRILPPLQHPWHHIPVSD